MMQYSANVTFSPKGSKRYDILDILLSFRFFMSRPKQVVCPYCQRSVVAKGMRRAYCISL